MAASKSKAIRFTHISSGNWRNFAHGASFGEILEGYPDLDREDILRAFEYAEWLKRWAN